MADNRCVCCGEQIPEGSLVCPVCANKQLIDNAIGEVVKKDYEMYDKKLRRRELIDYIMWDWVIPLLTGGFILYIIFGRW